MQCLLELAKELKWELRLTMQSVKQSTVVIPEARLAKRGPNKRTPVIKVKESAGGRTTVKERDKTGKPPPTPSAVCFTYIISAQRMPL